MIRGRTPPSLEHVKKYRVNRADQEEAVWFPLYDYQTYAATGQQQLSFFSNPIGQGVTSHLGSTGPKTEADTNMTNAGLLPSPQRYFCLGLEIMFWPGVVPAEGPVAQTLAGQFLRDVWDVSRSGFLTMKIGSKDYIQDGPVGVFPPSSRLAASAAVSDQTTVAATQFSQIDYATMCGPTYELSPFWIPSNQNFAITLAWPNAVALPSTVAGRIGVRLLGFIYRLSQ